MSSNARFKFGGSPATPNGKGKTSLFSQAPSTTPAGAPPTYLTNISTTPAGEPPRSSKIFGSSYNAATNTFGHRNTPGRRGVNRSFKVPSSSPPNFDEDEDEDAPGELVSPERNEFIASTIEESPRGLKRSRNGRVREGSGMADIARALVRDNGPAKKIEEPDEVVLGMERIFATLDVELHQQDAATVDRVETITTAVVDVTRLWSKHADNKTLSGAIGPELDDALTKASYISTLLLQLHHPHTANAVNAGQPASIALPRALIDWLNAHHNPLPDEFNEVHLYRPSPSAHEAFWDILGADMIRGRFVRVARLLRDAGWENAATAALDYEDDRARGYRGRQLDNTIEVIERFLRVLETCPAVTDDNWHVPGPEWSVFRQRVRHAIRELESFATASDDDDDDDTAQPTRTNMFAATGATSMSAATARAESRVPPTIYQSLRALYGVLLGGNGILDYAQDWVEAAMLLTVWWDGEESTAALNASIADLAVSRHASKKNHPRAREIDIAPGAAYRRRLGEMFRIVPQAVDEPTFQPDSLDPVHVALGTVCEDDVAEAMGMVRMWSQGVAAAVVEVAALGNWLPLAEGRGNSKGLLGRGFSSDDLMVLSHGPGTALQRVGSGGGDVDRDDVLTSYADLLAERKVFRSESGRVEREGWELAIAVLGRLNDAEMAQERIRAVLEGMEVQEESRVEKVLAVCAGMGFEELGRGIAERYADTLTTASSPVPYGQTLVYYARAHATAKLRSTLSLLISLSLLHSVAMPLAQNLDPQLASLLDADRDVLVDLAYADAEAAELLARMLSGYAMLRRFYDARDGVSATGGAVVGRRREAAKALVAVVESASDCIKGGLFDPEVESVVPVEGLLVLLGEVLPLLGGSSVNGSGIVFQTKELLRLMGVVEDYEQVSGRIREGGEGLLRASMGCFRGGGMSGSSAALKKSTSALSSGSGSGFLSGSGSWEELAESSWSLLQSAGSVGEKSTRSKTKTIDVQRGWDWRKGLDAVAVAGDVGSKEILLLLRTALAGAMGRAWGSGLA